MKKKLWIWILVLALLLGIGAAGWYAVENLNMNNLLEGRFTIVEETFRWEIRDGTAVITGIGDVAAGDVVIPAQIYLSRRDGAYVEDPLRGTLYPVAVAGDAFSGCDTIRTVTFEDGVSIVNNEMSVKSVGMFSRCPNLEAVSNIPDTVTSMAYTFLSCPSLVSVDALPAAVTSLRCCFYECAALEAVPEIPEGVTDMTGTFTGCSSLTEGPAIPESVTDLTECFKDCASLTSLGGIRAAATDYTKVFYGCAALTVTPVLPDHVEVLDNCFYGCGALTTVTNLPGAAVDLDYAFALCRKLTDLPDQFPQGVTAMDHTFFNCAALVSFPAFPETITELRYTFSNCLMLSSLLEALPEGLVTMDHTFERCLSLESAPTIPSTVEVFKECFSDCPQLTEATVNNCPKSKMKFPDSVDVTYLQEHMAQGLCEYCHYVTDTYYVDGLEVYFQEVPLSICEECLEFLDSDVPQELKDASNKLLILNEAYWEDYISADMASWTAGVNSSYRINGSHVSYSYVQVYDHWKTWTGNGESTTYHELAHGYDAKYRINSSDQWYSLYLKEHDALVNVHSVYGGELVESYAVATAAYFTETELLQKYCPGMYAYMDELWGTAE